MSGKKNFTIIARIRSFKYAVDGIWLMLRTQHNAWVHLIATFSAIVAGVVFNITPQHWVFIIVAMALVWVSEALNTAFEFLCDVASPDFHPLVQKAKDVSAGSVLISAICAAAVGCIVFVPYILRLIAL